MEWRTHCTQPIVFIIEEKGDWEHLETPMGVLPLFPVHPYNKTGFFLAKIPWEDTRITIEAHICKNRRTLLIWPTQFYSALDESGARREMVAQAEKVANFLSKWGGWRFSSPMLDRFLSHSIHRASVPLAKSLKAGILAEIDCSMSLPELEVYDDRFRRLVQNGGKWEHMFPVEPPNALGVLA